MCVYIYKIYQDSASKTHLYSVTYLGWENFALDNVGHGRSY